MQARSNVRRQGTWRLLLGVFVCALLVLEQLAVPLHLALNDHVAVAGPGQHVHSGGQHARAHARAHARSHVRSQGHTHVVQGVADHDPHHGPSRDAHQEAVTAPDGELGADGEHRPHPAEDHLDQLAKPALVRTGWVTLGTLPADEPVALVFDLPTDEGLPSETVCCRPPPERASRASRAPPIFA